jgi:hypothetical protein
VLAVGDELRPTGTDRGLLRRIAEQSGGKERDTLAGIFLDRDAERFAYTSLTPLLIQLAAFALLLSVAVRRLTLPEVLERAWLSLFSRGHVPAPTLKPPPARGESALAALSRVRERKGRAGADETPPSVPRFSRAAISPVRGSGAAQPTAPPENASRGVSASPTLGVTRAPTAAEILLARRRDRNK